MDQVFAVLAESNWACVGCVPSGILLSYCVVGVNTIHQDFGVKAAICACKAVNCADNSAAVGVDGMEAGVGTGGVTESCVVL